VNTFHYFVEGAHAIDRQQAAALGLAYAFEKGVDFTHLPGGGPEGRQGIMFAQQDSYPDGRNIFNAAKQTWIKIPAGVSSQLSVFSGAAAGSGLTASDNPGPRSAAARSSTGDTPVPAEIWVGYWRDAPPGPEDLARERQIGGHPCRLRDGHDWNIPAARSHSELGSGDEAELRWSINLPRTLKRVAGGQWNAACVAREYAELWALAEAWVGRSGSLDYQGAINGAVLALSANYRISANEVELLDLMTDDDVIQILDRLVDKPTVDAFQKKMNQRMKALTSCGGVSLSAGPAAETPITAQPSPT
jgi:hypothetical protein